MSTKMSNLTGDEIVISGIAGIFPNSENVQQLGENLFNKVDMVNKTNEHSGIKSPDFPHYMGQVRGMEKCDVHFFRVTPRQAVCIDPSIAKLMEQTYGAFFDAGINPETLKGSKIGVYISSMQMDNFIDFYNDINANPFTVTGGSKTMLANRISYWIDGKGPSYSFDNGMAGSMSALEMAYNRLKSGEIDCAVVGGSSYILVPELTSNMRRAGLLCLDGKTKCFDKNGDGFVRSNAVNAYVLQKAKAAKRIYSEVYYVKGKFFASPDGLFSPKRNPKDIENFLNEFYSDIDISPNNVEYVEANSCGIAEADASELEAIGNIFASDKTIKIGSVKSNMGNTEHASGACSVSKMCLAYQKGLIPPNLHYSEPQNQIKAVKDGNIQVVTDNLPFNRNFTAINNYCYTGANYHALLKGHYKQKDTERYKSSIPRLVLVSSRNEDGANKMLDILEANPIDPEQLALLNNFFKYGIPGHTGRGYTVLDSSQDNDTVCLSRSFEVYSGNSRPLCFLFSGMGSQWAGMGEGLLRIPVFAAAIEKCHKLLLPKGLDIYKIITDKNNESFNILNSIIAITAIQIGLCDVLTSLGITPDNIIGHSVGEIACAYADGVLTAEETILASYCRAIAAYETKFIKGMMAAVGIGHEEVAKQCPPEIEIACHNSSESSTISGPADAVSEFIQNLTNHNIFAKEVNSYNIAFHSRYISEAGPMMLELLKKVIKNPKRRSNKWLSSCFLPEDWHKPETQFISAEYLTHNLLGSVLFEEAASHIPDDALIIEIAPHGLLQAIMKRSHSQCVNLSLTKRAVNDSAAFLLKSLGNLYQYGLNIDLEALYPRVEFPVSTETPTLSHLIGWQYTIDRENNTLQEKNESSKNNKEFVISIHDDDFAYLKHYVRNGKNVLPEATLLVFVWETLADIENINYKDMPVKFEDIKIHKQVFILPDKDLHLEIAIQTGSNKFEVNHNNCVIMDGKITHVKKIAYQHDTTQFNENEKHLTQTDIYTILRTRGYSYEGEFKSIISSNVQRNKASVTWNDNWVTFLDSIIQLQALSDDYDGVSHVKFINKLTINTDKHKYTLSSKHGIQYCDVTISKDTGVNKCGGVIFRNIIYNNVPKLEIVSDIKKHLEIHVIKYGNVDTHKPIDKNVAKKVELMIKNPHDVESLVWADAPMISTKANIQVCYAGLSMKDYKRLFRSDNQSFGLDYSGLDKYGNKVMGILPGSLASTVEADTDLLWPVPKHWSLAEAATVPLPFVHACYILAIRSSAKKGSNIFITGAAGALGQAIICIALSIGCNVYATVANSSKKQFLLKLYPELDENNIGYTYDDTFKAMVYERTKNKKCDVVISCSSGKIREVAMKCVANFGLFLDLDDSDQAENQNMFMHCLHNDTCYKSVNLSTIFYEKYSKYKKVLHAMVSDGIAKGSVRPLSSVIYSPANISKAFKLLSTRNNIGRVLIKLDELGTLKQNLAHISRLSLSPKKSFIVLWDGSILGLELIDLLIRRGLKYLLIHCDKKTINGYFHAKYASWSKLGVTIEVDSSELQENMCKSLINKAETTLGSLDGILITCNEFVKTKKILEKEKESIANIVSHLDIASRECKHLRYFAFVTATSNNVVNEIALNEIAKCFSRRNKLGYQSLLLCHTLEDKNLKRSSITALLNTLELSINSNYVHVRTSDVVAEDSDKNITEMHTNFEAGLNAFYRQFLKDEMDASEPFVQMKTKISPGFESELVINPEEPHMIIIPGFEGNADFFTSISELSKKRILAAQFDPDSKKSIAEIAKWLLEQLKKRIHVISPFNIMGYSFGVNVALEMAALLEKEGLLGVVYCLDSSPDAVRAHLDAYLGNLNDEELQNSLIQHFYTLIVGNKSDDLNEKLYKATKWSEKVEIFINIAKYNVHYSHEYMKNLLQSAYERIKTAKNYNPTFKLDSELVLFKGIPHPNARELSNDYNLSKYSTKPVTVLDIEKDHALAPHDRNVSNYINRFFVL